MSELRSLDVRSRKSLFVSGRHVTLRLLSEFVIILVPGLKLKNEFSPLRPYTPLPSYRAPMPIYDLPELSCPILTMSLEMTSRWAAIFAEQ